MIPGQPNQLSARLDSLTSLRFFAATGVFFFHLPYVLPQALGPQTYFHSGALGVGFFFVLSGFVLAHANRDRTAIAVGEFYGRRFARLYPLHFLTFIVWVALFFRHWGNPLSEKIWSGASNVLLIQAWFPEMLYVLGYNAVSWTLSVEFAFYIAFPLIRNWKIALAIIVIYLFAVPAFNIVQIEKSWPNFFYFFPLSRFPEFCIGIIAYQIAARLPNLRFPTLMEIAGIFVVVGSVSMRSDLPTWLVQPFLGVGFAVAIAIFAQGQGWLSGILRNPALVIAGEASFAFYMVHHMTMGLISSAIKTAITGWPLVLVAFVTCLFISVAIFYLFEKPAQAAVLRLFGMIRARRARRFHGEPRKGTGG